MVKSSVGQRLAKACIRGTRQESLVNELLEGSVPVFWDEVGRDRYIKYGYSKLNGKSYAALKTRLIRAGFVFEQEKDLNRVLVSVSMFLPEDYRL